jgi:hypothetical protein
MSYNYNWYHDRGRELELQLADLENDRAYLETDDARETLVEEFILNDPEYSELIPHNRIRYMNDFIADERSNMDREMQEIRDQLTTIRTVMSTWEDPARRIARLPRRRLRVEPLHLSDISVDYHLDSPPYAPDGFRLRGSPPYAQGSPPDFAPSSPIEPPPGWGDISRDSTIMQDDSPEIIDLTTPPITPPHRSPQPPSAPGRHGGTKKAKRKQKTGKRNKRNTTKKNMRGGDSNTTVKLGVVWLGKYLLLHPIAKYVLAKRYGITDQGWCSFPVFRLAQEMIKQCRGGHAQVVIGEAIGEATQAERDATQEEIEEAGKAELTCTQTVGGKREKQTKKTKRKGKKQTTRRK